MYTRIPVSIGYHRVNILFTKLFYINKFVCVLPGSTNTFMPRPINRECKIYTTWNKPEDKKHQQKTKQTSKGNPDDKNLQGATGIGQEQSNHVPW